ncbi:hypothetical protein SS50377_23039 [Spironucleus salmonicida]|uniref:Uncharacterized protein n=1 Tax=Spironucleus salmonicida TaxID=348837 RepID=V6LV77_9EUKA|nr:hypothetical protein SS50377_23039 [Spironucleus salmonicida]|eukprot:EST47616.1 Hypothetical protein SS50377_12311 [Spironucleus salmonicida]
MTVNAVLITDQFDIPIYTYYTEDMEKTEIQFALYAALDYFSILSEKNETISEDAQTYAIFTSYNHKIVIYTSTYIQMSDAISVLMKLSINWQKIILNPFFSKDTVQELAVSLYE